ncbi:MAG: hypothetical protein U5K31_00920 [Balneolaceae bacterium]|nr:hypothetical protein [Balneolaceae bacterium]
MLNLRRILCILVLLLVVAGSQQALAQFEAPEFQKIETVDAEEFDRRFADISWTGQGMYQQTEIDGMPTAELRARLQARFGEPTFTIGDLIDKPNFRLGMAVQFEYRFVINNSIPLIILDVFGPFGRGLSYTAASRYIDMMPQIKRTLSQMLLEVDTPGNYTDYYYSADQGQWFEVQFRDGEATTREIDAPEGMNVNG